MTEHRSKTLYNNKAETAINVYAWELSPSPKLWGVCKSHPNMQDYKLLFAVVSHFSHMF